MQFIYLKNPESIIKISRGSFEIVPASCFPADWNGDAKTHMAELTGKEAFWNPMNLAGLIECNPSLIFLLMKKLNAKRRNDRTEVLAKKEISELHSLSMFVVTGRKRWIIELRGNEARYLPSERWPDFYRHYEDPTPQEMLELTAYSDLPWKPLNCERYPWILENIAFDRIPRTETGTVKIIFYRFTSEQDAEQKISRQTLSERSFA